MMLETKSTRRGGSSAATPKLLLVGASSCRGRGAGWTVPRSRSCIEHKWETGTGDFVTNWEMNETRITARVLILARCQEP